MIRFLKAAARGVKAELAAGESGWVTLSGGSVMPSAGFGSTAGKTVSPESALTLSAVWAGVSRTAQLISTLPLTMYEKSSNGGRQKIEPDLMEVLTIKPNSTQTAVEFWEGMVGQQVLRGNCFAEKHFIGKRLVSLTPAIGSDPELGRDGKIKYPVYEDGRKRYLNSDQAFHLRGFGAGNGLGLSVIRYGANSMGAALAADETAGSFFSNSMMPSGLIESDNTLNKEQREQLQIMLDTYARSDRAGKTMALEAGLKYRQLQMKPEDAQLLETRSFQVEDVCRWLGMPPIIIGHASQGQTMWGSGVEQIMLSWQTLGINPVLRKIEARILLDLIPAERRRKWYFEFNREAMLQMDSQAKAEFMSKLVTAGIATRNELRPSLNLERSDDPVADQLTAQTSLAPLINLGDIGK